MQGAAAEALFDMTGGVVPQVREVSLFGCQVLFRECGKGGWPKRSFLSIHAPVELMR